MKLLANFKKYSIVIVCAIVVSIPFNQAFADTSEKTHACPGADIGADVGGVAGATAGAAVGVKVGALACGVASAVTFGLFTPLCPLVIAGSTVAGGIILGAPSANAGYNAGAQFDDEECQRN